MALGGDEAVDCVNIAKEVQSRLSDSNNSSLENIKADAEKLKQYNISADEIIASLEQKYKESKSSIDVYDISKQKSSKNKNKVAESTDSDYELQTEGKYPDNWATLRKQAYERDEYRCQNCGVGGGKKGDVELHAHHIVPVSSGGNHTLSNLATLCRTCHGLIHPHISNKNKSQDAQNNITKHPDGTTAAIRGVVVQPKNPLIVSNDEDTVQFEYNHDQFEIYLGHSKIFTGTVESKKLVLEDIFEKNTTIDEDRFEITSL